jgi:tetratricopeptide (TPR) repeat protein
MESNNPIIAKCLDDLIMGKISRAEADELFNKHNIAAPEEMIDRHQMAAVAVQRYGVQMQVEQIHRNFMAVRALTSPEKIQQKSEPAKLIKMPVRKLVLRIAAAIVLFCICSFSNLWINNSSPKLYSELYSPYNVVVERGAAEVNHDGSIVSLYQQTNDQAVLNLFKETNPSGNRERFLAAMAATQLKDHATASQLLQQLLSSNQKSGSRLYNDHAEYYLMLTLLQQKQYSAAIDIAEKINKDSFHIYQEKISNWTLFKMKWLR